MWDCAKAFFFLFMKITRKVLCIIFFCICSFLASIIFIPSVSANMYCPDEYCTNQYYLGTPVMTSSSSDFPAYTGQNYTSQCQTENSLFELVAYDYEGDHKVESVVIPALDKISIYSTFCSLEKTIVPQFNIVSRPSLVDPDFTTDPITNLVIYSLAVLTNSTLDVYDDAGLLKYSLNYLNQTNGTSLFGLACTDRTCWAVKQNNSFWVYKFQMVAGITLTTMVNYTARWTGLTSDVNGYAQTINGEPKVSYCGVSLTDDSLMLCRVFNSTANQEFSVNGFGLGGTIDINHYYAAFVKMGSVYRYIVAGQGSKSTTFQSTARVYDDSYNFIFNQSSGLEGISTVGTTAYFSLPVVADFDKDGIEEYCYFFNDTSNNSDFKCYTNSFVIPKYNYVINLSTMGMSHFPDTFFMTDFNTSAPFLYIGTMEGIFNIESGIEKKVYDTGFNYTAVTRFSNPPILSYFDSTLFDTVGFSWFGMPVLQYADASNAFILSSSITGGVSCGDLVCEGAETIFNCAADCLVGTGGISGLNFACTDNANCTVGLCKYGFCRLAAQNEFCNINADCISNSCNAALSVCAQATLWQQVDASKDELAGDDSNTNNLVAIIIILLVSVGAGVAVGKHGGGFMAILLSVLIFFVLSIFFAIVTWLSWFIVLVELIVLVAGIIMMVLLGSRTT